MHDEIETTCPDFYTNFFLHGSNLCIRKIQNGERIREKIPVRPSLYVSCGENKKTHITIHGSPLAGVSFDSPKEAKEFFREYKDDYAGGIYGYPRFEYSKIHEMYPGINGVSYEFQKLNVAFLDIETENEHPGFPSPEKANERINAITVYYREKYVTFGLENSFKKNRKDKDLLYVQCESEKILLEQFLEFWTSNHVDHPDIITGWNIDFFDVPYLINRIEKICGSGESKKLSPWGMTSISEIERMGKKQILGKIEGVAILDYLALYKNFTYTMQESYKLDYIAHVELGENKIDYSDIGSFRDLYTKDWQKFIEYNIHDVRLIVRLEEKMKLIELASAIAFSAKVNLQDVFTSVRLWDVIISNYILDTRNMQVPFASTKNASKDYAGGYVKDPLRGKHDWTCSFDLTSLYPSLIRQYNISPDTLDEMRTLENLDATDLLHATDNFKDAERIAKSYNLTLCANGSMFRRNESGFLPELMKQYFDRRIIAKKNMLEEKKSGGNKVSQYNNEQMALKILLNSCYGCLGSPYFRLYDDRLAAGITISGQAAIQWIAKDINKYLGNMLKDEKDRIVAIDTDSVYVEMNDLIQKICADKSESDIVHFLDNVCRTKMQDIINESYERFADLTNAYENHMEMKREAIGHGIFVQKKRYTMYVFDNEGVRYDEPDLKIMGLEAVRSTTPEFFRKAIKDVLRKMYETDESGIISLITKYRKKFDSLPVEEIASPIGISNLSKYVTQEKGVPMHVKGALAYNQLIRDKDLGDKYEMITSGEKVKVLPLKEPNPLHVTAISFPNILPKEFELNKYIDTDTQFEKMFVSPLERVLGVIGWKSEESVSLDDFF